MVESELYKEGSTIRTSNVNKQNAELAEKYKAEQSQNQMRKVIAQTLDAKSLQDKYDRDLQWKKDFEGYLQVADENDQRLQALADKRAADLGAPLSDSPRAEASRRFKPAPSLLDTISDKLDKAFGWNSSQPTGAENFDDPHKELRMAEEERFRRHNSEQAGLAELSRTTNN